MQVASVDLLSTIIRICHPRMSNWSGFIVDGLARCWVALDETTAVIEKVELRQALQRASRSLRKAYPAVVENEYKQILLCDEGMFRDLFSPGSL